jgi:hypothetical protein
MTNATKLTLTTHTPSSALRIVLGLALVASAATGVGCAVHNDDDWSPAPRVATSERAGRHHDQPTEERSGESQTDGANGGWRKGDIVGWNAELSDDTPILDAFATRAEAYGCTTEAQDESVVGRCREANIVMVQKGRNVTVACKSISLLGCHRLYQRIIDTH